MNNQISIIISGPPCGISENASISTVLACWKDLNKNVICFIPDTRNRILLAYVFSSPEDLKQHQHILNQTYGVKTWYYVNDLNLLEKEFESNKDEDSLSNSASSSDLAGIPSNMAIQSHTEFEKGLNFIKSNPECLIKVMLSTEGEYKNISFLYQTPQNTKSTSSPILISIDNQFTQNGSINLNKAIDFNNANHYLTSIMQSSIKTEVYNKNEDNCSELRIFIFHLKALQNNQQQNFLFFNSNFIPPDEQAQEKVFEKKF